MAITPCRIPAPRAAGPPGAVGTGSNSAHARGVRQEAATDAEAGRGRRRAARTPARDADGQQAAAGEPRDHQAGFVERRAKQELGNNRRGEQQCQARRDLEHRARRQNEAEPGVSIWPSNPEIRVIPSRQAVCDPRDPRPVNNP